MSWRAKIVPYDLKGARQSIDMSVRDFASKVGVDKKTIMSWERARAVPVTKLPGVRQVIDDEIYAYAWQIDPEPNSSSVIGYLIEKMVNKDYACAICLAERDENPLTGNKFAFSDVEGALRDLLLATAYMRVNRVDDAYKKYVIAETKARKPSGDKTSRDYSTWQRIHIEASNALLVMGYENGDIRRGSPLLTLETVINELALLTSKLTLANNHKIYLHLYSKLLWNTLNAAGQDKDCSLLNIAIDAIWKLIEIDGGTKILTRIAKDPDVSFLLTQEEIARLFNRPENPVKGP